jgi:hypothetical protein
VTYDIDESSLDQIVNDEPHLANTPEDRRQVAAEIAHEMFDADYQYDHLDHIEMYDDEGNQL